MTPNICWGWVLWRIPLYVHSKYTGMKSRILQSYSILLWSTSRSPRFHPFLLKQQVLQIHDELLRSVVLLSGKGAVKMHMLQDYQSTSTKGTSLGHTYSDLHNTFANNQHPSPWQVRSPQTSTIINWYQLYTPRVLSFALKVFEVHQMAVSTTASQLLLWRSRQPSVGRRNPEKNWGLWRKRKGIKKYETNGQDGRTRVRREYRTNHIAHIRFKSWSYQK